MPARGNTSLMEIFQKGDVVDALDEVYIWWPAKVIDFKSPWEVQVKWAHFSKPSNAYSVIEVPESIQENQRLWNIRFTKSKCNVLPEKRARTKQDPLKYNPRILSRNDKVYNFFTFWNSQLSKLKIH